MFLIIFSYLKSFCSILIAFLSTKLGQICLTIGVLLLSLFLSYKHGFSRGLAEEKARNSILLANALNEQFLRLEVEKNEVVKLVESQQKTEKIYIKGKETIKIIKEKNPKLSSLECSLPKEYAIEFNNKLKEVLQ